MMAALVVVRGGGDLASGVVLRLARAGIRVVVTELPQPLAVRRRVSFAQAVFSQEIEIEGIPARLVTNIFEIPMLLDRGVVPVLVDPEALSITDLQPEVLVDGRMRKRPPELSYPAKWFSIGLGPGFIAGQNCDAAIETKRGHTLGRVFWRGSLEEDTGQPEAVASQTTSRVLRAPLNGKIKALANIGDLLKQGAQVAQIGDLFIYAPFDGVLRGLVMDGLQVSQGMKIGDLDPRSDPGLCTLVSDKALAVGGGVMEAILSHPHLRELLWPHP